MPIIKLNQIEAVDVYASGGTLVVVITYKGGTQKTLSGVRANKFLAEYERGEHDSKTT